MTEFKSELKDAVAEYIDDLENLQVDLDDEEDNITCQIASLALERASRRFLTAIQKSTDKAFMAQGSPLDAALRAAGY